MPPVSASALPLPLPTGNSPKVVQVRVAVLLVAAAAQLAPVATERRRCLWPLSTAAMIVSPIVLKYLDPSTVEAGAFLGGTNYDVAKVVSAGISASNESGEAAKSVNLRRNLDRTGLP